MLISLTKKFVHIANLKVASTSIERALRPFSEIALAESRFGKHMPLAEVETRFSWLFQFLARKEFLVFGAIRDPVDYVLSLYNSHSDDKFRDDTQLYTGRMDFDEFLSDWCVRNSDQLAQQHRRFLTRRGTIGANYIISFPKLQEGLQFIATMLQVPNLVTIGQCNASMQRVSRAELNCSHFDWINERFAADYEFIQRYCDCYMSTADNGSSASMDDKEKAIQMSVDEVIWCYRNLLGREPESMEVVQRYAANANDFRDLVLMFLNSKEYMQKRKFMPSFIPLNNPPMQVETSATAVQFSALIDRIRAAWTHMGSAYPHHSVLTAQEFLPQNLTKAALEEFWASGDREVSVIAAVLRRNGFDDLGHKVACEFGCGLGRVTVPLSKMFKQVHAYDISESHLSAAALRAREQGTDNVVFHLCPADPEIVIEKCDFFYSRIVFQHNPPPLMRELVRGCLTSLRPGGIAVFQVPTYGPNYTFTTEEYLQRPASGGMEMHCIPQREVFSIIEEAGLNLLEVREDGSTGRPGEWLSNTFVVERIATTESSVLGFDLELTEEPVAEELVTEADLSTRR